MASIPAWLQYGALGVLAAVLLGLYRLALAGGRWVASWWTDYTGQHISALRSVANRMDRMEEAIRDGSTRVERAVRDEAEATRAEICSPEVRAACERAANGAAREDA